MAVKILSAELERVLSMDDGEVVLKVHVVKVLACSRPKEEGLAKTKRREKADAGIGHCRSVDGGTGARFVAVAHVGFVEISIAERRYEVEIDSIDMRRTLDAVGRCAIRGHVKSLVRVSGVVEVVRDKKLILGVEGIVDPAEKRAVMDYVIDRCALVLFVVGLVEIDQNLALAVAIGVDLRIADGAAESRVRHRTRR